ncbi:MAG: hypothetical protein RL094_400 [Candidatus Parcubacteria bacterium]
MLLSVGFLSVVLRDILSTPECPGSGASEVRHFEADDSEERRGDHPEISFLVSQDDAVVEHHFFIEEVALSVEEPRAEARVLKPHHDHGKHDDEAGDHGC